MNSITEFNREFSQAMRGYAPAEVDAAIEMLVSYGAELESANAEFAEVNDELIAENDALAAAREAAERAAEEARAAAAAAKAELEGAKAALAKLKAELEAERAQAGDAKDSLEATRRATAELKAKAEVELSQIRARRTAEETRYNMVCRKTSAMTAAIRRVWAEQLETLDAIAGMTEGDDALDATPAPVPAPIVAPEPEPAAAPALEPDTADGTMVFEMPKKAVPQRVRRAAMAAAALEPDEVEVPAKPARPTPVEAAPVQSPNAGDVTLSDIFAEAPTQQFSVVTDAPHADGVNVDAVYRAPSPAAMKVQAEKAPAARTGGHSFAAVRRSLEEIGAKVKK